MLIVEDDPVVVETLTTYLEHAGFDVIATGDGADGLARAQSPDVAMVILDWMVPGMNGPEVCRRLRAVSSVPVLMLTARTAEDDRVRGLETGADDYVPKPFSPREVVARVQALLRRSPSLRAPGRRDRRPGSGSWRSITSSAKRVSAAALVALTPTEFRLVEALATHPGRTFSREELVARAFRARLRRTRPHRRHSHHQSAPKAHAGLGHSLIHTVHGVGYRLAVPE